MTFIGCDPGVHGAIAILSDAGELISVEDMPVFAVVKRVKGKDRTKNHVNVHDLGNMLRPQMASSVSAVIEHVGPMPNDGAMQAFQFGFATGALHGALGVLGFGLETVTPQKWKKHFGLTSDKGGSRQLATRRFPAHADLFKRVKDDGRAEAALIALYALETSPNSNSIQR